MRFQLRQEHISALRATARAKRPEQILQALQAQGVRAQKDSPSGDLLATDARGFVTRLAFEPEGLPAKLRTPSGAEYRFSHDREGRLAALTYPGGERVEMEHDRNGHIRELRRPGLLSYHLNHDAAGHLLSVQYPDESDVKLDYDSAGNLVAVTDRAGARTVFNRSAGRMRSITDALGRETVFETTAAGELHAVIFPDGSVEQYAFDPDLNAAVITARDGSDIIQELDAQQAIKRIEWSDGSWAEFELDGDGNLVCAQNAAEKTTHAFDANGNPSREETSAGVVSYSYDVEGRLTQLTTPPGEIIKYDYDPDGRINCIHDWEGRAHHFVYAANGTVAEIHYGNGLVEQQEHARVGRLRRATVRNQRGRLVSEQIYAYDLCERLTYVQDASPETMSARHLEYDAESRILREVDAANEQVFTSFAYDAKGNLVSHNGVALNVGLMDEPCSFDAAKIDYDDLGNMRRLPGEKGEIACEFSADGTLRAARVGNKVLQFKYDALGRRILKTDGRTIWRYGWAGHQLLWEEFERTGTKPQRRDYLFVPDSVTPIAFREKGRTYWLQSDARGAVIRAFDEEGNVAWQATYDSFGVARVEIDDVRQPWRLVGQYHDDETGLHYNFARYYSPYVKSYLSRDPNWFQFEATNYSYARNDPWNRADPFGAIAPLLVIAGGVLLRAAVGAAIGAAVNTALGGNPWAGALEGAITGMSGGFSAGLRVFGGIASTIAGAIVEQANSADPSCVACSVAKSLATTVIVGAILGKAGKILKLTKVFGKKAAAKFAKVIKRTKLNEGQLKNLKRFERSLPKNAKPTKIHDLPNGGKAFQAEVPAKEVPGSKAVYEKQIDVSGNTTSYTKTTYAPDGSVVHVKTKYPPGRETVYGPGYKPK